MSLQAVYSQGEGRPLEPTIVQSLHDPSSRPLSSPSPSALLAAKDEEITIAKSRAKWLREVLNGLSEIWEHQSSREMAEHATKHEQECIRAAELQKARDANLACILKLQHEIQTTQQSTSELQGRFQHVMAHQVTQTQVDNAIDRASTSRLMLFAPPNHVHV
ncbi:hypothetical protein PM082_011027 [Marasmius tenuissimus]|nr:hypothetical protein PM082_011027 [Marasmius tenuissimus]